MYRFVQSLEVPETASPIAVLTEKAGTQPYPDAVGLSSYVSDSSSIQAYGTKTGASVPDAPAYMLVFC